MSFELNLIYLVIIVSRIATRVRIIIKAEKEGRRKRGRRREGGQERRRAGGQEGCREREGQIQHT